MSECFEHCVVHWTVLKEVVHGSGPQLTKQFKLCEYWTAMSPCGPHNIQYATYQNQWLVFRIKAWKELRMGLENGIVGMNIARLSLKPTNIREGIKKRFFLRDLSQMWVGGVADSQTRSKPLKPPPNHPENRFFRPKFHLSFSQISQKPWGGWVNRFGKGLPKRKFFYTFPYCR